MKKTLIITALVLLVLITSCHSAWSIYKDTGSGKILVCTVDIYTGTSTTISMLEFPTKESDCNNGQAPMYILKTLGK